MTVICDADAVKLPIALDWPATEDQKFRVHPSQIPGWTSIDNNKLPIVTLSKSVNPYNLLVSRLDFMKEMERLVIKGS